MYGKILSLTATMVLAGPALADQSDVTIYGVLDSMVRVTTNEARGDGVVGNKLNLGDGGALQGSRLGFSGQETLNERSSALFKLEMGFKSNSGASDQQGQLFGRQAYIGLNHSDWGEIDLGRQYGVAFDVLANYDPVGMGNLPETQWQLLLTGVRFDHALKYSNQWSNFRVELQYAPGGGSGSNRIGSTSGLGLNYTSGPVGAGAFVQQSFDANTNRLNVIGVGTSYLLDTSTFYLNYFEARRDPGFQKSVNNSSGPLANTSLLGNRDNLLQRVDHVVTVGVQYKATPVITYTVGYMKDLVKNELSSGSSGQISTSYALINYAFSKRTDIYAGIDHTRVGGGESDQGSQTNTLLQFAGVPLLGHSTRSGLGIGLRHSF